MTPSIIRRGGAAACSKPAGRSSEAVGSPSRNAGMNFAPSKSSRAILPKPSSGGSSPSSCISCRLPSAPTLSERLAMPVTVDGHVRIRQTDAFEFRISSDDRLRSDKIIFRLDLLRILIEENAHVRLILRGENHRAVKKHTHDLVIVNRWREFHAREPLLDFIFQVGRSREGSIGPGRSRFPAFAHDRAEHDRAILLSLLQERLRVDPIDERSASRPQDGGPELNAYLPVGADGDAEKKGQAEKAEDAAHSAYASQCPPFRNRNLRVPATLASSSCRAPLVPPNSRGND